MPSSIINLIIKGRKLVLPAIFNLETDITTAEGKNIGDWGWSKLVEVARFINDTYETMGVHRVLINNPHDLSFVFDRFGLLNGHNHGNEGKILVTWINEIDHAILGQKPDTVDYGLGIFIPSGWVSFIKQCLSRGVIEVVCEKTITGIFGGNIIYKLIGMKIDGSKFDLVFSGDKLYFLPPTE